MFIIGSVVKEAKKGTPNITVLIFYHVNVCVCVCVNYFVRKILKCDFFMLIIKIQMI